MKKKKRAAPVPAAHNDLADWALNDPVLRTVSRAVFALVMLFALLLLWRGHQLPGGGFIAGLMTVCALLLHRIAYGETALPIAPERLIPPGLMLSLLTAMVPYLFGKPFLKSDYGYLTTPMTGEFEWASAMLFDLGVYLTVVGGGLSLCKNLIDIRPTALTEDD